MCRRVRGWTIRQSNECLDVTDMDLRTKMHDARDRRVDDVHVSTIHDLIAPKALLADLPLDPSIRALVYDTRADIARIISGEDPRLLAIVGPCSVHDVPATLEYANWLRQMRDTLNDELLMVMRVYFEKPRTRGGWKGLINDPGLDGTFRINDGLRIARKLLLDINNLRVPTATEFVDPITPQYLGDLISWAAIGARTVESPVHRELASGLSCPVGFKNGTNGDVQTAVNAVVAASRPQRFLGVTKSGHAAIVSTNGNPLCHVVLRGGARPNYDAAAIAATTTLLATENVMARVMVDCSHGNSAGDYRRQLVVAEELARQRRHGSRHVFGIMAESNLLGGRQTLVSGCPVVPGISVTDPCLGIEDTAALLHRVAGVDVKAFAV
jgi:3-deoxy-7-phosphoheptulonate synthase